MRKLTVLATLGLIALVSVSVLLFSLGTIGTAHAGGPQTCENETLTGTINGSILAPTGTGECRLDGVTVNGHVTVGHSGVQLILVNGSVIKGGIRSPGGTVQISDSTVKGGVDVKDSDGSIKLERSVVNGNVKLMGNGTVVFTDNTIDGNVNLKGNGGFGGGSQTVVVTGNIIDGNLTLKDNTNLTESGNTVSGKTKITP